MCPRIQQTSDVDLFNAGNAQVYLFQNYALLQRPPDSCLKALEKFSWDSFGLEVEVWHPF